MTKIAARYIGNHPVTLHPGKYTDADGNRLTSLILSHGDTIMMEGSEVLGQTYLYDPRGVNEPLYLGVGHRVLPDHRELSRDELSVLGYEWHSGRPDFEPLHSEDKVESPKVETPVETTQSQPIETVPLSEVTPAPQPNVVSYGG